MHLFLLFIVCLRTVSCLAFLIQVLKLFVIHVSVPKVIDCLTQNPLVSPLHLLLSFSLMFGVLPLHRLAGMIIMLALLMTLANTLGSISSRRSLMFFQVFKNFKSFVERQFNTKILAMQTDWSGEYRNLNSYFQELGIAHHVSCPHAHQ